MDGTNGEEKKSIEGLVKVTLSKDQITDLISRAIDGNKQTIENIVVKILNTYEKNAKKIHKEKADILTPEEMGMALSEALMRNISQGVIDAYGTGFNSGLTAAFDIIDAKMRELLKIEEVKN
jgi:hypothetical protein